MVTAVEEKISLQSLFDKAYQRFVVEAASQCQTAAGDVSNLGCGGARCAVALSYPDVHPVLGVEGFVDAIEKHPELFDDSILKYKREKQVPLANLQDRLHDSILLGLRDTVPELPYWVEEDDVHEPFGNKSAMNWIYVRAAADLGVRFLHLTEKAFGRINPSNHYQVIWSVKQPSGWLRKFKISHEEMTGLELEQLYWDLTSKNWAVVKDHPELSLSRSPERYGKLEWIDSLSS